MQFNSNSDFPGSSFPSEQWATTAAQRPIDFDTADFIPCACITTRVIIQCDNAAANRGVSSSDAHHVAVGGMNYIVKTAKGVVVRSPTPNVMQDGGGGGWSDSDSGSSDWSDDDMIADCPPPSVNNINVPVTYPQDQHINNGVPPAAMPQAQAASPLPPQPFGNTNTTTERAYWLRRSLRQAIYGQVRYGIVLNKLNPPIQVMLPSASEWVSIEWEETNESVAVKEMNWEHIRAQRDRLAEDPIKEVAAMQYLSKWLKKEQELQIMQQMQQLAQVGFLNGNAAMQPPQQNPNSFFQTPQNMLDSHIMMPMDLLSDDRNLYSVMPYCTGGELFDVLETKNRFSEPEARFWMTQILKGLSCLKKAGVAHRDLSLENLLVHEGNVLVIDMGMCLRIPVIEQTGQRYLILPQGVCGKWHYMSPEVCKNQFPFDGPAVDLWAAGVILFLMLTGFPPWERPVMTDERFKYMSNGYLVQMLTEWQMGLSADAMDLLQRMFWLDPTDRLSLEQVVAHPWMNQ